MPYIPPEIVAEARQVDLLTYLKNYEPYELVEVCRNTYTTKSHDSLKISNGLWYWFTKGVGGKSAIDYLIKVRNFTFINAVQTVLGNIKMQAPVQYKQQEKNKEKHLKVPIKADKESTIVHLFESSIDLLSYATLLHLENKNWRAENLLSLGGIYSSKYDVEKTKIPVSLTEFLERNPNINEIYLHLDRDLAGRNASSFFQQVLSKNYQVCNHTIPFGKDVNEYLCLKTGIKKIEKERSR